MKLLAVYDYSLLIATLLLIIIGIFFIYSSGVDAQGAVTSTEYIRQIIWAVTGLILMLSVSFVNHDMLRSMAPIIYTAITLSLLITLLVGSVVNGARSWLGIASFGIQPSEFMKIGIILLLAVHLERSQQKGRLKLKGFITAFLIILLPSLLVLLQPDLGTAAVYIPITIVMLYIAGSNPQHLFLVVSIILFTIVFTVLPEWESRIYSGTINFFIIFRNTQYFLIIVATLLITFIISITAFLLLQRKHFLYLSYFFAAVCIAFLLAPLARRILQDHQMLRLLIFLDPSVDPKGAGWHIIQSVTAVGSGGFSGKGFLQGTQSHLQFLPQQSTDFVFSILAEEWGFLGGVLITILYMIIILRGIYIASVARSNAGAYIAIGICTMFSFHYFVSVGMAIGLMPIAGIPLMLLSYGGSSLWTAMIGIGILISISRSRLKL